MIYYVKQGQSSIFQRIQIKENECEISKMSSNSKKIEKTVRKIKKKNIQQIVLSRELKENEVFIKMLKNYDITIFEGKWLMQYMLQDIIEYLNENKKLPVFDEITILANDLTDEAKENIKNFANIYKKIRIITNHSERFKRLEEELYEKNGISIILTNNKRKAMSKSMLIINFDFVEETINQYNIYENAIIINLNDKIRINKKRFSGLIITDYEVNFEKNIEEEVIKLEDLYIKQMEFSLKEIVEEKIYTAFQRMPNYNRFEETRNLIKKYNLEIKELYGINGLIK